MSQRKDSDRSTSQIDKSVRCHECEGFGHYQVEYYRILILCEDKYRLMSTILLQVTRVQQDGNQ